MISWIAVGDVSDDYYYDYGFIFISWVSKLPFYIQSSPRSARNKKEGVEGNETFYNVIFSSEWIMIIV